MKYLYYATLGLLRFISSATYADKVLVATGFVKSLRFFVKDAKHILRQIH